MARPQLSPHPYVADQALPPWRRGGAPPCRCGLPRSHERHQVPEQSPERAAYEARRIGEREETHVH